MCEHTPVQKEPLLVQYFICLSPKDGQHSPKLRLMAIIKGPLAPNGYLFWCQLMFLYLGLCVSMLQYKNNHFWSSSLVARAQNMAKIVQNGPNGHH